MDKMREEFEAWINSETGFDCFRTNYQMTKPEDQQYMCHSTTLAWRAWKASRALLCVELPPKYNYRYPEPFNDGFDCAVEEIEETLCKCGVPYK